VARPYNVWRLSLVAGVITAFVLVAVVPFAADFFALTFSNFQVDTYAVIAAAPAAVLMVIVDRWGTGRGRGGPPPPAWLPPPREGEAPTGLAAPSAGGNGALTSHGSPGNDQERGRPHDARAWRLSARHALPPAGPLPRGCTPLRERLSRSASPSFGISPR
jgi:hypothetical protein